jgi:hypothetical protein
MISRLSTAAALFAVLATATLALAVEEPPVRRDTTRASAATSPPVLVLPRVEVIGRRGR